MIPASLLFMAHIQYLDSAWRNYIGSILLHGQFQTALCATIIIACLQTWLYIDHGHDSNWPGPKYTRSVS